MSMLEKERITSRGAEQLSPQTLETFSDAEELILDLQDSPAFAMALEHYNAPFDDTTPKYWEVLRTVTERSINLGNYADNDQLTKAMRIAAAAPDAAYKQYELQTSQNLTRAEREHLVRGASTFNDYLRDYVVDNLDLPFSKFSLLLVESASKGLDQSRIIAASQAMKATLTGIRTEIGLEQKADTASLSWRRGTTEEDLRGIDYIIEGIPVDIKSSLHDVIDAKHDSNITKPYFIKNGKVTLFPYEYTKDYNANTFRISDNILMQRSEQLARDIVDIKQSLHF